MKFTIPCYITLDNCDEQEAIKLVETGLKFLQITTKKMISYNISKAVIGDFDRGKEVSFGVPKKGIEHDN